MYSKIRIREIRDSDINELVSFRNAHYAEQRTVEQWIWEFKSCYPDLSIFSVIESMGRIVGTQGMLPIYINIKGRRYLSCKREGSLLLPEYRGGNLYQELLEFADSLCRAKDAHFSWGFSPAVGVRRPGSVVYENCMHESILFLNAKATLCEILKRERWTVAKKLALSLLGTLGYLYSMIFRFSLIFLKKSPRTKYTIEHRLRSMDDLNKLYGRLREIYPNVIHIDQDEEYITWRIYNNPNIKYETYFVYENSLLRGYCYVGTKDNNKGACLTDFTFESTEAGAFLLRSLLDELRNKKIGYVYFLGNAKNPLMMTVFSLLKRFGLLRRRSDDAFVLKNLSYSDEEYLYDIKNWYLGGLWREGYSLY